MQKIGDFFYFPFFSDQLTLQILKKNPCFRKLNWFGLSLEICYNNNTEENVFWSTDRFFSLSPPPPPPPPPLSLPELWCSDLFLSANMSWSAPVLCFDVWQYVWKSRFTYTQKNIKSYMRLILLLYYNL